MYIDLEDWSFNLCLLKSDCLFCYCKIHCSQIGINIWFSFKCIDFMCVVLSQRENISLFYFSILCSPICLQVFIHCLFLFGLFILLSFFLLANILFFSFCSSLFGVTSLHIHYLLFFLEDFLLNFN